MKPNSSVRKAAMRPVRSMKSARGERKGREYALRAPNSASTTSTRMDCTTVLRHRTTINSVTKNFSTMTTMRCVAQPRSKPSNRLRYGLASCRGSVSRSRRYIVLV